MKHFAGATIAFVLCALLCSPLSLEAASNQAVTPNPAIPSTGILWQSTKAEHIYGLPDVKHNKSGTLTLNADVLNFTGKSDASSIPRASITAVSAGNQRVEMGGLGMRLARMAIPDGGGLAAAALMHHRIDMLTVEFQDGQGGHHAAVFFVPATEADRALQSFSLLPVPATKTSDVRRAHLTDILVHYGRPYVATILLASILMSVSYGLVISRIRTTVEAIQEKSTISRSRLFPVVLLLILLGSLATLVSSQAVLWGLKQAGWNLAKYVVTSYDLLSVHAGASAGFCLATALAFATPERYQRSWQILVVLATLPVLCAAAVGVFFYYQP